MKKKGRVGNRLAFVRLSTRTTTVDTMGVRQACRQANGIEPTATHESLHAFSYAGASTTK